MRPFRIRALTALLSLALMVLAAVPASADQGSDGSNHPRKTPAAHVTPQFVDPGDGGALRDPGDGGAVNRDPGDGGVINSDPGDGGGVSH